MKQALDHKKLVTLAEIELSPEEEWNEWYREWKQAELQDLWCELKRIEKAYLRKLQNRKRDVERAFGVRVKARVPKKVIEPPVGIAHLVEQ